MIDAAEIRVLCRRRDAGVIAEAAHDHPAARALLADATPAEREALLEDGREARREMIEAHLGLVGEAVRRFLPSMGMDRDDYFQEGVVGLARAVDRYDPDRTAFSTFAVPHIRGAVTTLTMTRGGDLRQAQAMAGAQVEREISRRVLLGLPTSTAAIAAALNISEARVVTASTYRRPSTLTSDSGTIDVPDSSTQRRFDRVGDRSASDYLFMLPPKERSVLRVVHSDAAAGRSMIEIAAELGYSTRQLRTIINAGHRHLRVLMDIDKPRSLNDPRQTGAGRNVVAQVGVQQRNGLIRDRDAERGPKLSR